MTRDLKHRIPGYQGKKPRETPEWLVGLVLILATGVVAHAGFKAWNRHDDLSDASHQAKPAIQFSFFDTIPDDERFLPENEVTLESKTHRMGKQPKTGLFFVHAGSFVRQTDAVDAVTRLRTLTGTEPRLETIERDRTLWYRVRLGPYQTIPDADIIRQFLREKGIDTVIQAPIH